MSRGRLIFPVYAEIAMLDTEANLSVGNYDPDFRETRVVDSGDGIGTELKATSLPVRIPCQIEDSSWGLQDQTFSGNAPGYLLTLVMHFSYLEKHGLVLANGEPKIKVGDQLIAIYDGRGLLVQYAPGNPPLFANEVRPILNGLGSRRNLLISQWADREKSNKGVS